LATDGFGVAALGDSKDRRSPAGRTLEEVTMEAQVGDRIKVESNHVGGGLRTGEIVEIVTGPAGNCYRIRWDDGHETSFFPSSDASVEHAKS
jgi:hypothetical protein